MEDPQCSGRPAAAFMSLSMLPTMHSGFAGCKGGSHNPVDLASQPTQTPCRQPPVAWFPSFGGRNFGQRGWSSITRINTPFALGVGAGTGGSMLVSSDESAVSLANRLHACPALIPTYFPRVVQRGRSSASWWHLAFQK